MPSQTPPDPLKLVDRIVGSSRIPTLPAAAMRLLKLCRDPDANAAAIGEVVRIDPALAARLLEVVNSARYGLRQHVTSVDHATAMLGIKAVRSLALGFALLPMLRESADRMPVLEVVWRRSVIAAVAGQELARGSDQKQLADDAFVAGLLQDLGVLALLAELCEPYERLLQAVSSHAELAASETRAYGAHHARVGATLARSWGFPPQLVEAIRWHAEPHKEQATPLARLAALGGLAADALALDPDLVPDAATASALLQAAREINLSESAILKALDRTRETVNAMLRSFSFQSARMADPTELLQQANRMLQDIAIEQQQQLARLDDTNASLRREADLDGLTGILNRRALDRELLRLYNRSLASGRPLTIALIDLDRFKAVNDEHGHHAGDLVLRQTTERLQMHLRKDTCLGRFGGEEFLLILPDTDLKAAVHVAERLRRAIADEPFTLDPGRQIRVTLSGGLAALDPKDTQPPTPDQLVARADATLYEAKHAGRDRILCSATGPLRRSA